jgi:hypothetical protein
LLRDRRRLNDLRDSFDWVTGDRDDIQEMLAWPFKGYWRSVKRHDVWWPEWGERPDSPADQKEKLRCIFADAPKLIPLTRGLYLPDEPHEVGNPIFSIMQTDIVFRCQPHQLAGMATKAPSGAEPATKGDPLLGAGSQIL